MLSPHSYDDFNMMFNANRFQCGKSKNVDRKMVLKAIWPCLQMAGAFLPIGFGFGNAFFFGVGIVTD